MGSTLGLNFTHNYTKYLDKDISVKAVVKVSSPKNDSTPINTTIVLLPINMTNDITTEEPPTVITAGTTLKPVSPLPPDFNLNTSCIPSDNNPYGCFQQDVSVRGEQILITFNFPLNFVITSYFLHLVRKEIF